MQRKILFSSLSLLVHSPPRTSLRSDRLRIPLTASTSRNLTQRSISPQIYEEHDAAWQDVFDSKTSKDTNAFTRDSLLKIISWNINFASPHPAERVGAAMEYLQETFGSDPGHLTIFLQEVCQKSVDRILQTRWVQQNFVVTGHQPPRIFQAGIPRPAIYFTLMMTPKSLRIQNSFRVPLPSEMGRDALFVDIPISCPHDESTSKRVDVLRLCTTHLESLGEGTDLRKRQLQLISQVLKEERNKINVVAGVLGGDMNSIFDEEHSSHHQSGLKDAWEDPPPVHQPNADGDGNTWGYQSRGKKWQPSRLDKFMYTGCIQIVPLSETSGNGVKVKRLGLGLMARIPIKEICGTERMQNVWVSDHYAIAVGTKIPS